MLDKEWEVPEKQGAKWEIRLEKEAAEDIMKGKWEESIVQKIRKEENMEKTKVNFNEMRGTVEFCSGCGIWNTTAKVWIPALQLSRISNWGKYP